MNGQTAVHPECETKEKEQFSSSQNLSLNAASPISGSALQIAVTIEQVLSSVAPELAQIEEVIHSKITSESKELEKIANYLLSLGGKRMRPLLGILTAKLFGMTKSTPQMIQAAAGVELIHMATLLHDDIIDQSPKRRNHVSAYVKFGLTPTLLTGDFLLTRAFGLCSQFGPEIIGETEKACVALSEGELLEGHLSSERRISLCDYLNIIGKKTSSLFSLACSIGSQLGEAKPEQVEYLREFGYLTGIAFQMIDDILDISGTEELLGKPVGSDLRQQTPSLPNVLWLNSGAPEAVRFFSTEHPSPKDCAKAVGQLRASGIIEQASSLAKDYATRAYQTFKKADNGQFSPEAREQLLCLLNYTLDRFH